MLRSPILSRRGKIRFLRERFVPPRESDDDESLASFARRRYGNEVFERLVQPLVGGIYTADPEKLSLGATLPRFQHLERRYGSLIRAVRASAEPETEQNDDSGAVQHVRNAEGGTFEPGRSDRSAIAKRLGAIEYDG